MEWDGSKEAVHQACADLRFAQGLRRRWREARAEAAMQEAWALGQLEGIRLPLAQFRGMVEGEHAADETPGEARKESRTESVETAQARGIWRAAWRLAQDAPPLSGRAAAPTSRPLPAVLAGINRDVCSYLAAQNLIPADEVALPQDPAVLAEVMRLAGDREGDALERAARIWALLAGGQVFPHGRHATAALFVKWFLLQNGVEPTGVATLGTWAAQNQVRYQDLVDRSRKADDPGMATSNWQYALGASVIDGCAGGMLISQAVMAGRQPN